MRTATARLVLAACATLAACSSDDHFLVDAAVDTGTQPPPDVSSTRDVITAPVDVVTAPTDTSTVAPDGTATETGAPDVVTADARTADAARDASTADQVSIPDVSLSDVRDAGATTDVTVVPDVANVLDSSTPIDATATDASVTDATDAGADASATDASAADTSTPDSGVFTLTRATPVIDGTIGTDWPATVLRADNTIPTGWGATLNYLNSIRLAYDDTSLYFAIDGTVESSNAIVLYLDLDYGASTGITVPGDLADTTGELDYALGYGYGTFPGNGFGADWAWGTVGMLSHSGEPPTYSVGLRLLRDHGSDYGFFAGDTTSCIAANHTCEVGITWATLYPTSRPVDAHLALFVRLVNKVRTGISTQTLPQDDGLAHADRVSQVLRFTVP